MLWVCPLLFSKTQAVCKSLYCSLCNKQSHSNVIPHICKIHTLKKCSEPYPYEKDSTKLKLGGRTYKFECCSLWEVEWKQLQIWRNSSEISQTSWKGAQHKLPRNSWNYSHLRQQHVNCNHAILVTVNFCNLVLHSSHDGAIVHHLTFFIILGHTSTRRQFHRTYTTACYYHI